MSSNNYPSLQRISILIDFCLDRFISKKEMIKYLEENGHAISSRTLNRDFDFLKSLDYEFIRDSNSKQIKISDQNIERNSLFNRYKELKALDEMKVKFEVDYKTYVIDTESKSKGLENIKNIFKAIDHKRTITFKHIKRTGQSEIRFLAPMQLKVSDHIWYVIGYDTQKKELRTFGLDRILDLREIERFDPKQLPSSFINDLKMQYYILGVTFPFKGFKIETIILKVSSLYMNVWKSHPIHHSQKILEENLDGSYKVSLMLIPNIDLVKLIISSLGEIELLSPLSLTPKLQEYFKKIKI